MDWHHVHHSLRSVTPNEGVSTEELKDGVELEAPTPGAALGGEETIRHHDAINCAV